MRKPTKKQLDKIAMDLWHKKGYEKWGNVCVVCGSVGCVGHHYVPRSRSTLLKYDVINYVPLCHNFSGRKCHYRVHNSKEPDVVRAICDKIREVRGKEWCDYIEEKRQDRTTSFYTVSWLESQIEKLREEK